MTDALYTPLTTRSEFEALVDGWAARHAALVDVFEQLAATLERKAGPVYVSDGSVRCAYAECAALIRKRLP